MSITIPPNSRFTGNTGGTPDDNNVPDMPTLPTGINVKAACYGAVGNGCHDDTRAFQDALDFLAVTGGCLHVPRGNYKITAPLTWTSAKPLIIRGEITQNHAGNCGGTVLHVYFHPGHVLDMAIAITLSCSTSISASMIPGFRTPRPPIMLRSKRITACGRSSATAV